MTPASFVPWFRRSGLLILAAWMLAFCAMPSFAADSATDQASPSAARPSTVPNKKPVHATKKLATHKPESRLVRTSAVHNERARTLRKPLHPAPTHQKVERRVASKRVTVRTVAKGSTRRDAVQRSAPELGRDTPQVLKTALVSGAASAAVRTADKLQVSHGSTAANDDPLALRSGSALVVDEGTDRVLLSKNADLARPIASLTKLMTAAVILDAHQPMDQVIEITDADIDTLKWSSSRLRPGTKLTREELLKLALMSSENRAAHALARNYPGGLAAFIPAMNAKAKALGMNSTRYVEPTGLSPQNESTAHDLALLVKAVYHYPLIREFSTHPESEVDVGRRTLQFRNTDHLVFNRGWDILLQKTGYINEAGHCLVLQTKFEGRRVIVVLLDAWGKYSHFGDAQRIRTWLEAKGFDALHDRAPKVGAAQPQQPMPGLVHTALVDKAPSHLGE